MRKSQLFFVLYLIVIFLSGCNQIKQVNETYELTVGSNKVLINGEEQILNAPVIEIKGNTYIPLRFFAERFNAGNLLYDARTEKITFTLKRTPTNSGEESKKSETLKNKPLDNKPSEIAKPKETVREKTWMNVTSFQGSSMMDSPPFTITADEWRIRWSTNAGELGFGSFQVFVESNNNQINSEQIVVSQFGSGNGITNITGSGSFYLTIFTTQKFNITVEEKR